MMNKYRINFTAALLLSAPISVLSSEISSLQGYYKTKASINYGIERVQQNKVDFIVLDDALSRLEASTNPQTLNTPAIALGNANYNSVQKEQAIALYNALNEEPEEFACVINKTENTKIVFLVDDQSADCNLSPEKSNKAIALTSSSRKTILSFFRQLKYTSGSHYYVEQVEKDNDGSKAIISRFINEYPDQTIAEISRVEQTKSGSYMVEYFSDYGEVKNQSDVTPQRSFQWTAFPIREDSNALIKSMSYEYGKNATFKGQSNTPNFWATKERVKGTVLRSGKKFYYAAHVEQAKAKADELDKPQNYQRFRYDSSDKSSWLTYNFNNANQMNFFSPDECIVYNIRNNEPVIRFTGFFRTAEDCVTEPKGYERLVLTEIENDNQKTISVSDPILVNSAANIIEAIESHTDSENITSEITEGEMRSMKGRYDRAAEKHENIFSPVFW